MFADVRQTGRHGSNCDEAEKPRCDRERQRQRQQEQPREASRETGMVEAKPDMLYSVMDSGARWLCVCG